MARYALINANGDVENVIEWDGKASYTPPGGFMVVEADEHAEPGGSWDGLRFQRPVLKPFPPAETLDEKLARLGLTRDELKAAVA